MSTESIKERVISGFDKFVNQGDLSEVNSYIAPTYKGYFSGFPPVSGQEGFRQFLTMQNNAFSDRSISVEEIMAEGDKVVLRLTFRGTHTGELNGLPATGRKVEYQAINIMHMDGDQCVEQRAILDSLTMMQQLGILPG